MKKLVVNADDFGRTSAINAGIIEGHQKGVITSATIMTTGEAFNEAVALAQNNPKLGIGLHLDLDDFFIVEHGVGRLTQYKDASLPLVAIAEETEKQIKAALDTGLKIVHLDGHHHVHLRPELFATVAALSAKYKIRFIRYFRGFYDGLYPGINFDWVPDLVRRFGLSQVDRFFAGWEAVKSSLPGYSYFDPEVNFSLAELMVHPGKGEDWREKELSHCISSTTRERLAKGGIELVRFDQV